MDRLGVEEFTRFWFKQLQRTYKYLFLLNIIFNLTTFHELKEEKITQKVLWNDESGFRSIVHGVPEELIRE